MCVFVCLGAYRLLTGGPHPLNIYIIELSSNRRAHIIGLRYGGRPLGGLGWEKISQTPINMYIVELR